MSTLSITLPSQTVLTNGKQLTFRAPCDSNGVTGLYIDDDSQIYILRDSLQQPLSEDIAVFKKDVMVNVVLDIDNHYAYVQTGGGFSGSLGAITVTSFNGRQGSVKPETGDYTAEMVGAAASTHASQHATGGLDPITPTSIGAAAEDHTHDGVYSPVGHSHDDTYALIGHNHDEEYDNKYAAKEHTHILADIEGLGEVDGGNLEAIATIQADLRDLGDAFESHTHTPEEIGAARADHTHTAAEVGAAATDHTHTLKSLGAAAEGHTHNAADIGAAAVSHTHTLEELDAAAAEHTHSVDEISGLSTVASTGNYSDLNNIPSQFSPATHAATHATGGSDEITPASIGALDQATADELYSTQSYVDNAVAALQPTYISKAGDVSVTIADNTEYTFTSVTSLTINGNSKSSHGIIYFGSSISTPSVSGFLGNSGDDISTAAAGETWEFDTYEGLAIWKNWSV